MCNIKKLLYFRSLIYEASFANDVNHIFIYFALTVLLQRQPHFRHRSPILIFNPKALNKDKRSTNQLCKIEASLRHSSFMHNILFSGYIYFCVCVVM